MCCQILCAAICGMPAQVPPDEAETQMPTPSPTTPATPVGVLPETGFHADDEEEDFRERHEEEQPTEDECVDVEMGDEQLVAEEEGEEASLEQLLAEIDAKDAEESQSAGEMDEDQIEGKNLKDSAGALKVHVLWVSLN